MTIQNGTIKEFTLADFQTPNYRLEVGESSIKDQDMRVYKIVNARTTVVEYECTFFYEALGYLRALEDHLVEALEEWEERVVKIPTGE